MRPGLLFVAGARTAHFLARALTLCDEVPLEGALARSSGLLCGRADTADIVDASVALVAAARSQTGPTALVASDPTDLRHPLQTLNASVRLVTIRRSVHPRRDFRAPDSGLIDDGRA